MNLEVLDSRKNKVECVEVSSAVFKKKVNEHLVHEVVRMQLANRRQGTAATKNRSLVRGGGKKPWKQKGTGRARAGTSSSPLWVGGGVVFGPQPRDYKIKLSKTARKSALRGVLSDKIEAGKLLVLDKISFDAPKTKEMVGLLNGLGLTGRILILLSGENENENICKSASNLPKVDVLDVCGVNVVDVLRHDFLLVEKEVLKLLEGRLS